MSDAERRFELIESQSRNKLNTRADLDRFRENALRLRTGLTPSQYDLQQNFISEAQEQDERERTRIRPLQFIFNLLQTGQYVSANVWKEVKESRDTGRDLSEEAEDEIKGIWEGIVAGVQAGFSGGREGRALSFEDVWFDDIPKEERTFAHKAAGFFGDVLLDPTTWLTFGAGGAARGVAAQFAMDSAKVAIKETAPDLIAKLGRDAFVNPKSLENTLKKLNGASRKYVRDEYNRAYRKAIVSPGGRGGREFEKQLTDDLQNRLNKLPGREFDIVDPFKGTVDEFSPSNKSRPFIDDARTQQQSLIGTKPVGRTPDGRMPDPELPLGPPRGEVVPQAGLRMGQEGGGFRALFRGNEVDESLNTLQRSISEGYSGIGQREARVAGIKIPGELGRLIDAPMRAGRETFEILRAKFGGAASGSGAFYGTGKMFGNALWGVLNGGPVDAMRGFLGKPMKGIGVVGALRKQFGFLRTPFESMQHASLREWDNTMGQGIRNSDLSIDQAWEGLSPNQSRKIRRSVFEADTAVRRGNKGANSADILGQFGNDPSAQVALGNIEKIRDVWIEEANQWARAGSNEKMGNVLNYFPIHFTDDVLPTAAQGNVARTGNLAEAFAPQGPKRAGQFDPSPTKTQYAGPQANLEQNKAHLRWALGDDLDEAAAQQGRTANQMLDDLIENKGWNDFEIDMKEAMKIRGRVHERMRARHNMIQQFKEFGIKKSEIPEEALTAIGNNREFGLRSVGDPSLDEYFFDSDIAEIIERSYDITKTGPGQNGFKKYWAWYTRYWKAFATLTPRFHIRNSVSNQITGFLKHGLRWLDINNQVDASVATYYALHKGNYVDMIADHLKKSEAWVQRRLNKRVGNKTLREVADEAEGLGAMVPRGSFSKEINPSEVAGGKSLLDTRVFKFSQGVGDTIENQARMASYLLDYKAGLGFRGNAQYAAKEARKWFLDYDDLTEFEQNTMRAIIPFYSWIRKNLVNQISGLVLHGNLYSLIPKGQRLAQSGLGAFGEVSSNFLGLDLPGQAGGSVHDGDLDYSLLKDWEQNLGLFPVWADRESGKSLLFDPFFAYQDLNMIPLYWEEGNFLPRFNVQDGLNEIMSSAHPGLKTFAELAFGKNAFKQKDIRGQEIAPKAFQSILSEQTQIVRFLDGIMRLGGQEEGSKMRIEDGVLLIDGKVERMLDNNIPVLRTIGSIIESVVSVNENVFQGKLQETLEEINGEQDYNTAFSRMLRSVAFWFGAKFREFDSEERQRREAERIRQAAEKERGDHRRTLPGAEERSQERSQRRIQENQRLGLL